MDSKKDTDDNSIPDFLRTEKIDDALKNIFRQELQIYIHNQESKPDQKWILGFPSILSSRSRFILHSITSTEFSSLVTFSVGEEPNRQCYVISRNTLKENTSDTNQEEEFHFESLEDVETSAGCPLDILNILTDQKVLQKIQSGCDVAVNQAVNLSHVVELYDFPPTLKTSDLDDVLHQLKLQKYYELIWVDDTHAFAIMSDNEAAEKVLQIQHNLVKLRPFSQASSQSREKAKLLGLYGVDIYKKRPKTSMVAANRMLNRALGIKGDRSHNKASTADSTNNESLKGTTTKSDAQDHFTRNKRSFKDQNDSASIAANRMLNRALGLKSDNRLKPRTRNYDHGNTTTTCDNYSKTDVSDNASGRVRHNRNNYDPNLAANRMFKRALGSSVRHHNIPKQDS